MCRRAALALLAAALGPAARAQDDPCPDGVLSNATVTKLDFANSTVAVNTLHEPGGELRFDGIGVVRDVPVSLVVTDTSGLYANIAAVWAGKNPPQNSSLNGKDGELAQINLQTVLGDPDSGKGNFQMCIVDTATDEP